MASSPLALLVDFGSTYTKAVCFDLQKETIVGRAQAVTTVKTHLMDGLNLALSSLQQTLGSASSLPDFTCKLACSSAAGGLRLVAIGLIPSLTLEAARQAALGAGARIVGSYHHHLTMGDVTKIELEGCDLILLTGGTDGGEHECILANARALAGSRLAVPIVVAGNRVVGDEVQAVLRSKGKEVHLTENVLPTLEAMNVEPARGVIRDVFVKKIVEAKGLRDAQEFMDGHVMMPTPMAVLKAAELLAKGSGSETGFGEVVVVDVGGATTDVHSVARGYPTRPAVVMKGMMPPLSQRTVEGDLGIRYNAGHIASEVARDTVIQEVRRLAPGCKFNLDDLKEKLNRLHSDVGFVPSDPEDQFLDSVLARCAVHEAMSRHAASLKPVFVPEGQIFLQTGKDLTHVDVLIGVGGIFAQGKLPEYVLGGGLYSDEEPMTLKPRQPLTLIDKHYILYAIGLLSTQHASAALRIGKKYLLPKA